MCFCSAPNNVVVQRVLPALTFTTPWANLADDKAAVCFLFFPENRKWHFMQIVSKGDNFHEMSNTLGDSLHELSIPVFMEN